MVVSSNDVVIVIVEIGVDAPVLFKVEVVTAGLAVEVPVVVAVNVVVVLVTVIVVLVFVVAVVVIVVIVVVIVDAVVVIVVGGTVVGGCVLKLFPVVVPHPRVSSLLSTQSI